MNDHQLYNKRLSNFRSVLDVRGLDAIVLINFWAETAQGGDYNLYYISNLLNRFMQCFLVITHKECVLWIDNEDKERVTRQSSIMDLEMLGGGENWGYTAAEFAQIVTKGLAKLAGKGKLRVGVNGRFLPGSVGLALAEQGIDLVDVGRALEISRCIKDASELELIRKAAHLADLGVNKVMESIREGITEHELNVLAEAEMRQQGADCFWWKSLLACGNDAYAWPDSPTDREISRGDLVIMDFTPVYKGYGGDIARCFVFGKPSSEQLEVFKLGELSLELGVEALRRGASCEQIMAEAAKPVIGTPYEDYYIGVGHGIGLFNDNYPNFLAPISKMYKLPKPVLAWQMKPGMVVAMEIIFTIPGLGGVRLEDNYIVMPDSLEKLTHAPIVPYIE